MRESSLEKGLFLASPSNNCIVQSLGLPSYLWSCGMVLEYSYMILMPLYRILGLGLLKGSRVGVIEGFWVRVADGFLGEGY